QRLVGRGVQHVVAPLPAQGWEQRTQRCTTHDRPTDGGEAAARGLQRAVWIEHLRTRDAAPRVGIREARQLRNAAWLGDCVWIGDHNVLAASRVDALVDI